MNATPAMVEIKCPKCDGARVIAGFSHILSGKCFRCAGNGTVIVSAREAAEVRVANEVVEANKARAAAQDAWLAKLPTEHGAALAALRGLSEAKLWSIRNVCCDIHVSERDLAPEARKPGARMGYWAASWLLNAWPSGKPYPKSWVQAA